MSKERERLEKKWDEFHAYVREELYPEELSTNREAARVQKMVSEDRERLPLSFTCSSCGCLVVCTSAWEDLGWGLTPYETLQMHKKCRECRES